MNLRSLSIPLTMFVSFSLAFGYLWWQRPPPPAQTIPPAPLPAVAPPPTVRPITQWQPADQPRPPLRVETSPPMQIADRPPDLPVTVTFRSLARDHLAMGTAISSLNAVMHVTVRVVSARTSEHSEAALNIPANGEASFGGAALHLQSGDEVTLQSPPFKDYFTVVP